MSGRARQTDGIAEGLAAIEGGELRAEDRRRFQRRSTDDQPDLRSLEQAIGELRSRVGAAHKIKDELVAAREIVSALRSELRAMQAELSAERVASRRARMQASWLQAELRRREETERHLRAALASLTDALTAEPGEGAAAASAAADMVAAGDRLARERAEQEVRAARQELALEDSAPAGPSRPPADAVAELRDALAELSGQGMLPEEPGRPLAEAQDFEAAAARLRARGNEEARTPLTLAARGTVSAAGPWLRDGLVRLSEREPERAERLLVALVAAQAGRAPRPITYELAIRDGGSYRVSVMPQGAAAGPAGDGPSDGRIEGPLDAVVPLVAGGGTRRLRGAKVRSNRALRSLLAARREPVQLAELALLLRPMAPRDVLEIAALAVEPAFVDRDALIDVIAGDEVLRVVCRIGEEPQVTTAGVTAADATITVAPELLAAALAGQRDISVTGELAVVAAFLGWLDRSPSTAQ